MRRLSKAAAGLVLAGLSLFYLLLVVSSGGVSAPALGVDFTERKTWIFLGLALVYGPLAALCLKRGIGSREAAQRGASPGVAPFLVVVIAGAAYFTFAALDSHWDSRALGLAVAAALVLCTVMAAGALVGRRTDHAPPTDPA